MREIKFRAWSNEYNQYLTPYGYPNGHSDLWLRCEDGKIYDLQGNYEYDEGVSISVVEMENVTIEQYTGLKDKNGKDEAYENDQFRTEVNMSPDGISSAHNISFWIPVVCTIVFRNGSFVGKYEIVSHSEGKYNFTNRKGYVKIPSDLELIGNIHEESDK
jgi:uncharacterized phage protein (TIGR01671 family)